ncbi:unnamed protein product [Rotaria magnacalcarata]|uniref:GB1/RHD3-type G domain-containing protein n=4 Tax=Rotaria magnacalcarata TaxID=392030 RepID=A0A816W9I5_9BILA|nr:unnamed protein product [Rotaria magnacalcarata]CAF1677990.1 unnamed protein product [Rotaria magnacalcarata]CAF2088156.1 unnamed protein product [Rotaria magnacalcarata]CAF2134682.1 unnamed protein product [Rotaria magnacalcarata]CAF2214191.1 unnamed protein product [Rotaria magnacalcarata]
MEQSPSAGPVQIVSITEDHKFVLDEKKLKQILFHKRALGKKISLVSIAGDFRKGKSFMLDFFLRYLRAKDHKDWIGREDEPLKGFDWRGGATRHTTGMIMWSEPFLLSLPTGEEIAVFLMDTQGTFDSNSTVFENAFIFALTLLVSSVTVYNIMHNLQEDNLQHLSFFAEYGVLAIDAYNTSPFQQLTFLVRDWQFEYETPYGFDGGEEVLSDRLRIRENQHHDLALVRSRLKQCFRKVNCFLMPHPGLKVTNRRDFDGRLLDIEQDFKKQLLTLVPELFNMENGNFLKEINGEMITSTDLFEYFKSYCTVFASGELPTPKAMLEATAEANNLAAKSASKEFYIRAMEQHCGGDRPYIHPNQLEALHKETDRQAVEKFRCVRKMGGEEVSMVYQKNLEDEIIELYSNYKKHNDSKNVFAFSRTPTTFISSMILCYFVAGILDTIWLGGINFIFMFAFWVCFFLLFVWLYTKYSGEYADIGQYIDYFADVIWNNAFQPAYSTCLQSAMRSVLGHAKTN